MPIESLPPRLFEPATKQRRCPAEQAATPKVWHGGHRAGQLLAGIGMAFDRDGPKLSTVLFVAALSALAGYNHARAKRALAGRAHGHVMEVDGLRLHFIEAGTGMPLILLHGNGSMAQDF